MFSQIPQITKNILILNVLFFIVTMIMQQQGVDLEQILGAHYIGSPSFQPFQIVTHFFMHADLLHLFMNMWLFVMLGAFLEKLWGPKKFFIFYLICALSAFALLNMIGMYDLFKYKNALISQDFPIDSINTIIRKSADGPLLYSNLQDLKLVALDGDMVYGNENLINYVQLSRSTMVGASGAIFGIMTAFAILFPNTEFYLYFAIPVKAKYLVGAYLIFEVVMALQNKADDPVAHLAHIGGAIAGAIIVLIWRKRDRRNFW